MRVVGLALALFLPGCLGILLNEQPRYCDADEVRLVIGMPEEVNSASSFELSLAFDYLAEGCGVTSCGETEVRIEGGSSRTAVADCADDGPRRPDRLYISSTVTAPSWPGPANVTARHDPLTGPTLHAQAVLSVVDPPVVPACVPGDLTLAPAFGGSVLRNATNVLDLRLEGNRLCEATLPDRWHASAGNATASGELAAASKLVRPPTMLARFPLWIPPEGDEDEEVTLRWAVGWGAHANGTVDEVVWAGERKV